MAQTNYTPISLYYSTTASAAPTAGNLVNGELAININDGKLYYKDSGGVVQVLAWKNVPISTLSGAGTGVLTALAVNVGTAGSFVVNGGALGTPSSGTLTNATGLPISTGVSGLGTGVATALAVNTGTAGAFVVNGGALGTPSSGTLTNATGLPLSTGVTGTLPVTNGGTGQTSYTDGQLLIGNTTGNTLTKSTLTAGSGVSITNGSGSITISATGTGGTVTSVNSTFTGGIVSVGGVPITTSGTIAFTVAGTSGGIPYFSSASAWASSAALAANAIVLGGGAGAAPATTTTGTGVVTAIGNNVNTTGGLVTQSGTLAASALLLGGGSGSAITSTTTGTGVVTALGVNVGTAGAFVVNGGALGTPSSGTVTNLTGTASININGTVGATTPTTGAFTTLTASSDSSFTSTGALLISKGTTVQQPGVPATGMIRYNTTTNAFEGYSGSSPAWNSIGGATLSNDTSTASNLYPIFANATSGSATTVYTSNAKLLYKPSTGELSASEVISTNGLTVMGTTMSSSYTLATGNNALTVGPFSVASGVVFTISTGQRHVVI